jgi:hypothetical protein
MHFERNSRAPKVALLSALALTAGFGLLANACPALADSPIVGDRIRDSRGRSPGA